ncbi:MAG: hypothetical protein ABW185_16340 [Sedimenticola sp.]
MLDTRLRGYDGKEESLTSGFRLCRDDRGIRLKLMVLSSLLQVQAARCDLA